MARAIFAGSAQWVAANPESRVVGLFRKRHISDEWQQLTNGLPAHVEIRAIAMHPFDPDRVVVATQVGPYQSMDAGESWAAMNFPAVEVCWSLLFAPNNPDVIYCGTVETGVYMSADAGANWQQFSIERTHGYCQMGFPTRVIGLAVNPGAPQEIYAALEVSGLTRSLDGGQHWQDCNRPLMAFAEQQKYQSQLFSDTDKEGMLDSHALAICPTSSEAGDARVILANRMGLFESTDQGTSWNDVDIGRYSALTYARDVVVSPHAHDVLYAAFSEAAVSDKGSLFRSDDGGKSWQRFDHDIDIQSTLMSIGVSHDNENRVYCAARRGQIFGTEDGGATWQAHPLPRGVEGVYAIAC